MSLKINRVIRINLRTRQKVKICYYCGKMGYFIKDCFKKQNDLKELKEKKVDEGNAVLAYDKQNFENDLVLVHMEKKHTQEWILDFGCSFRMCSNKVSF